MDADTPAAPEDRPLGQVALSTLVSLCDREDDPGIQLAAASRLLDFLDAMEARGSAASKRKR